MEKPIIAATTGLREYIDDGKSGLIVPPNNPKALAEAIEYLWHNPEHAQEMGRYGRKMMEERFSVEAWINNFKQIINSHQTK